MQHHQIQHSEIIDGLKYEIIHEDHQQKAVDFFFEVFLKAQCSTNRKKKCNFFCTFMQKVYICREKKNFLKYWDKH